MTNLIDLHLHLPLGKKEETEDMLHVASELGYKSVGIPLPKRSRQDLTNDLRKVCISHGLDLITRVDLSPKSPKDLIRDLRQLRRRFELVSVNCQSKAVARQAAKDHRVDLLVFPSINPRQRFFDLAEARLASQGLAALEVEMASLLRHYGSHRVRLISCLRKEVAIAKRLKVPIVISSNAHDIYEMRGSHEQISLATLFDLESNLAREAVTRVPMSIVKRNREKLSPSYVARGIRVVRRGKSCDE